MSALARAEVPNDLEAFWMPFTPNRAFKKRPRLISRARDMHYFTPEGRPILDATAARCGFDFKVVHIAGVNNTVADLLSRPLFSVHLLRVRLPQARPLADPTPSLAPSEHRQLRQ